MSWYDLDMEAKQRCLSYPEDMPFKHGTCVRCHAGLSARSLEVSRRFVSGFLTISQVEQLDTWVADWNPDGPGALCPRCIVYAGADCV